MSYLTTTDRRSAVAVDGVTPVLLTNTTRNASSQGCAGTNPSNATVNVPGGAMLILVQAKSEAAPSAADMQAGKWTYYVEANGSWQDGGRYTEVYACMLDAADTGAAECWELV